MLFPINQILAKSSLCNNLLPGDQEGTDIGGSSYLHWCHFAQINFIISKSGRETQKLINFVGTFLLQCFFVLAENLREIWKSQMFRLSCRRQNIYIEFFLRRVTCVALMIHILTIYVLPLVLTLMGILKWNRTMFYWGRSTCTWFNIFQSGR